MHNNPKFGYAQHKGGARAIRDTPCMSVDLTLDILGGCAHSCPGCFVNKKLPFLDQDLQTAADIVKMWDEAGYDLNEIFLGPTDLFSAFNFDLVVNDPNFAYMLTTPFTLTTTSTCLNDLNETQRRLDVLKDLFGDREGRNFEIFVVLDIPKYLNNDREYLDLFNDNLKLLEDFNVFLIVNLHDEFMFDNMSMFDLSNKIKADYNTKIRINPSYFRGTNIRHVEKYAKLHGKILTHEVSEATIQTIFLNMIDIYFGGFTFGTYSLVNHELYITPVVYEAVSVHDGMFKIDKNSDGEYCLEDLEKAQQQLFYDQYQYTNKTNECDSCKHLASCISRNVLSYMESRNITNCFLPKELFRDASRVIELEERKCH